jgi:hypothetical protein
MEPTFSDIEATFAKLLSHEQQAGTQQKNKTENLFCSI